MALLVFGKRKALTAFNKAAGTISKAGETLERGDYDGALSAYNEALELLRSDLCRQSLASGLIAESVWSNQVANATLGRVKAVAALDPRNIVFEQVEKIMFDVFGLRPDLLEAHEFMAELALYRGYAQAGGRYVRRELNLDARHPRARFWHAMLDFENAQYGESITKLRNLEESSDQLCYLARCYLRTGKIEDAIQSLESARSKFGANYKVEYYTGCAFAHAGNYAGAARSFESAVQLDRRRGAPLIQLGHLAMVAGSTSEAERFYKEAIKLNPRDPQPAYYGLALLTSPAGGESYRSCIEALRRLNPASDFLYSALGDRNEWEGRIEEAVHDYSAVAFGSPMTWTVSARVGLIRYRGGNYSAAVEMLRRSTELHPGDQHLLELLIAAAAMSGDFELALEVGSELSERAPLNARIKQALEQARIGEICNKTGAGQTQQAIDQLESYCRDKGDPPELCRVLTDLYFLFAIELLTAEPARLTQAREALLLAKHATGNAKFEYCLALADLMERHYQTGIGRMHSVLAANAKNPGASYHLGYALLKTGDEAAAETALRHGVAVSMNQPNRLGRLKWGLAALLVRQGRWEDAADALEGFVPLDEPDSSPTRADVLDVRIRCLVMVGDWESAERAALGEPRRKQTPLSAIILARRNMKAGRPVAALGHLERYFRMSANESNSDWEIDGKARAVMVQLSLKSAALQVHELRFAQAEATLRRVLSVLAREEASSPGYGAVRAFLEAFDVNVESSAKIRLADRYASLVLDEVIEKEDIRPPVVDMAIVLPLKPRVTAELLERPLFDPGDWDASPYPDPLIVFDS